MAHVLLFPFPAQGHIPPMLNLAELLSHAGLYVTILNTDHIHARLSRSSKAVLQRFSLVPRVRFRSIPDGLPEEDPRPFIRLLVLEETMRVKCRERYRELLVSADGQEIGAWPPVTCVVADGFLRLGLEVAEEMRIPTMILRTSSACSVWAYYNIPELIKRGEIPFEDEGDLDKAIHCVAGMESFLRRRDLPSFIREAKSTNDHHLRFVMNISTNLTRAKALILNTVESIEAPVLSHIRSVCPITYTVGPLHTLINTVSPRNHNDHDAVKPSTSASLWQDDRACLTWLDSQPPNSVAYVSFGSITVMSRDNLLEFWHGLVNSGHPFLWVVRPDLVQEGTTASEKTPPELEEATKARGCLVAWAPQQEVLAHPAVGCFLTHSGWNSTMESMVEGVPMICWPFVGDQLINSRYVSEVWKIGMDIKDMQGRNVVEMMVREVMDGKGADEMKRLASEMADMARESSEEQGSSYQDLQRLIQHIKSFSAQNN